MIRVSAGTEILLGFRHIRADALSATAYLMIGEKCSRACAFCPQAVGATPRRTGLLSRVVWAEHAPGDIVLGIARAGTKVKRICLQCLGSEAAMEEALTFLQLLRQGGLLAPGDTPRVSVSMNTTMVSHCEEFFQSGADRIGLPIDVADEATFRQLKGGSLGEEVARVLETARKWPGRITVHFIVGLGETEREILELAQLMIDERITVALFSFTPIPGTRMEEREPPALPSYRRIQLGLYLISHGLISIRGMSFNASGQLTGINLPEGLRGRLLPVLYKGKAFMTTGCPDCNRPYYNERPGGTMYNYPWPPTWEETVKAVMECQILGG
ncbi:MAG TPA: radical SAM protein [Firmicutes bacterium]|nr:radical SAM protein [Bacillota bacterium]